MKYHSYLTVVAASILAGAATPVSAEQGAPAPIYETPCEFFASGDFDRDGRADLVIVDKESGKYRLGYQLTPGVFSWVDCRPSGMKGIAGISIGAFAGDGPGGAGLHVPRREPDHPGGCLQPDRFGQAGDGSIYGGAWDRIRSWRWISAAMAIRAWPISMSGPSTTRPTRARRPCCAMMARSFRSWPRNPWPDPPCAATASLSKPARPSLSACWCMGTKADTLRVQDLSSGKPVAVATVADLPAGSDYAVGNFRGSPLREFIFYKPGENKPDGAAGGRIRAREVPVWQGRELRPGPAGAAGGCRSTKTAARSCSSSSARAKRPGSSISTERRRPCWSRA